MSRCLTRIALIATLAATATLGIAASAGAAPQLLIREVHRGPTADSDYVMLQMTADGQNTLAGNYIDILDGGGMAGAEYELPNVPNGQNQRTVLIGNTGVIGADFTNAGVALQQDGGVCLDTHNGYDGTGGFDCVAWGNFTGSTHPLSSPALPTMLGGVGLSVNQTLQRTISRGCADRAGRRGRHRQQRERLLADRDAKPAGQQPGRGRKAVHGAQAPRRPRRPRRSRSARKRRSTARPR